mgnify:CR=1 FL=1
MVGTVIDTGPFGPWAAPLVFPLFILLIISCLRRRAFATALLVLFALTLFLAASCFSYLEIWRLGNNPGVIRTQSILQGAIAALKAYQTEYNRLPLETLDNKDAPQLQRSRGIVLRALTMDKLTEDAAKLNPRVIKFYEPPLSKNQKGGLYYDDKGEPVLVDAWGEPFYFMLELNGNGVLPNPDPDPKEPRELSTRIIIFSSGPDRDPTTWKDNIKSW